ncbi:MAG: M23 family metallopeptidase [Nocardioidaceae bacterium]|nr:M23 family metallopeptidase [Nocardioidaceae bacterium]
MGNHRAHRRAPRRLSAAPDEATKRYVGKRVAGRSATTTSALDTSTGRAAEPAALLSVEPTTTSMPRRRLATVDFERAPTVELPALHDIPDFDPLTDSSSTTLRAVQPAGKRRAVKHVGHRGPLFRGLPTLPVAAGVATLAIAVGGAVVSTDAQLAVAANRFHAPNAMTGSLGAASVGDRAPVVSRDSERATLAQASGGDIVEQAERSAAERATALGDLQKAAEKEAGEISLNRWVKPLDSYRLTARFGEYGLWSSYHTGLDFAAPSGTPIHAVANGTVTSASFDGAYGNKTVVTLEDGTELWYCHQTSFTVSAGDKVRAGELIGYVGSTGHVTGPHMHLEVRPGGGDPVDPDAALRQHGVTP